MEVLSADRTAAASADLWALWRAATKAAVKAEQRAGRRVVMMAGLTVAQMAVWLVY
jgi:hypothetical protein